MKKGKTHYWTEEKLGRLPFWSLKSTVALLIGLRMIEVETFDWNYRIPLKEMHWFPSSIIFNHTTRKHRGVFLLGFYSRPSSLHQPTALLAQGVGLQQILSETLPESCGVFHPAACGHDVAWPSSSWWLNQPPIWKIFSSKWVHLPQFSGWTNKNHLSCHHLGREVPVVMLVPPGWIWNRKRSG